MRESKSMGTCCWAGRSVGANAAGGSIRPSSPRSHETTSRNCPWWARRARNRLASFLPSPAPFWPSSRSSTFGAAAERAGAALIRSRAVFSHHRSPDLKSSASSHSLNVAFPECCLHSVRFFLQRCRPCSRLQAAPLRGLFKRRPAALTTLPSALAKPQPCVRPRQFQGKLPWELRRLRFISQDPATSCHSQGDRGQPLTQSNQSAGWQGPGPRPDGKRSGDQADSPREWGY